MTEKEYFVGIYGLMQLSMIDVGLLYSNGRPIKGKYSGVEKDALFLYDWVSERLHTVDRASLRKMGRVTDENVKKLINDHSNINNFLLSVMLFRLWVNDAKAYHLILLGSKINRVIDMADKAVSDEEFSAQIKRQTARTEDNLYRIYANRPQLSDEVRDAHFKNIRRKR